MKPFVIAIFILLSQTIFAQENIDRIEKVAKEISNLQYTANNLKYQAGNTSSTISFAKSSFIVYLNNLTASQSYYSQTASKDTLFLIEDIPLHRVSSIDLNVTGNLEVYILNFPSNLITVNQFYNGKPAGSHKQDFVYLFSHVDKFEDQFVKLGLLINLAKEEKNLLAKGKSNKIYSDVYNYLHNEKTIEQRLEAAKKMVAADVGIYQNLFKNAASSFEQQLAHYSKTASEYRILKSRIDRELKTAATTYKNYNSYLIIDTMTTAFLKKFSPEDFRNNEYGTIKNINLDASYRYRWNKEFTQKYDQVKAYDQLKVMLAEREAHRQRMVAKTYSGGALVRMFMLTFGGISTLMGTYGMLDKEESAFSKPTSKVMLTAGASTVATSLLWSGIVKGRISNANKKYQRTQTEIKKRERELQTLLDKRLEKKNGTPVIHENK